MQTSRSRKKRGIEEGQRKAGVAKGEGAGESGRRELSQVKGFDLEPNISGKPLKDLKQSSLP